ncbi:hypothetical protein PHISP_08346, partial [Aspergillus sp. HF37]
TLDPITLFHSPSLSASNRALQILQRASIAASEATISQDNTTNRESSQSTSTSAHDALHNVPTNRGEFQLDVTTAPPTTDQLRNIFEYLGSGSRTVQPSEVIQGATDARDALRKFGEAAGNGDGGFIRPVIVDWINGKAVVGDDESEIIRMVKQLPAEGKKDNTV